MRRFSDRHTLQTLTEINVTPLLDLAFVLLVIFIITTPLMENSVNLVVPTSGEAIQSVDPSQVQTISIDKDDVMRINDEIVDSSRIGIASFDAARRQTGFGSCRASTQGFAYSKIYRRDGYPSASQNLEGGRPDASQRAVRNGRLPQ